MADLSDLDGWLSSQRCRIRARLDRMAERIDWARRQAAHEDGGKDAWFLLARGSGHGCRAQRSALAEPPLNFQSHLKG